MGAERLLDARGPARHSRAVDNDNLHIRGCDDLRERNRILQILQPREDRLGLGEVDDEGAPRRRGRNGQRRHLDRCGIEPAEDAHERLEVVVAQGPVTGEARRDRIGQMERGKRVGSTVLERGLTEAAQKILLAFDPIEIGQRRSAAS